MYDMFDMVSDMNTPITEKEKKELKQAFKVALESGRVTKQMYYHLMNMLSGNY